MSTKPQNSNLIEEVCTLIADTKIQQAERFIEDGYPFLPVEKSTLSYTPRQMTEVFLRDGFIDRYKGERLVFPPVLRVLSHYLPNAFPYHKNGKMDAGHIAYWELFATIDHVVPVSRGGVDRIENWVCCSKLMEPAFNL